MPSAQYSQTLEETKKSLVRIQTFECKSLIQEKQLGEKLAFTEAATRAQKIVNFAQLIAVEALGELPEDNLQSVRSQMDGAFRLFENILRYSPEQGTGARQNLINQCDDLYNGVYNNCLHAVSYSLGRTSDFKRLEREGMAAVQYVKDKTEELLAGLREKGKESESVLEEIRKVAAEQGVSQQALYFREESEEHKTQAEVAQKSIRTFAWLLAAYAVGRRQPASAQKLCIRLVKDSLGVMPPRTIRGRWLRRHSTLAIWPLVT